MTVPFFDSKREYRRYKSEFDAAIQAVIESGAFILGSEVSELEAEICKYTGAKYAIGVANGSDALVIAADILACKNGVEVITPAYTFFATASCIARLGGKPVFCDVDEETFCINVKDAEKRVTENTRGIIPVHLFLQSAGMETVIDFAKEHKLTVLEDAAESFGIYSNYKGKQLHTGTVGDAGIFSFFPTKTLGAYGDAGMIVTNSEEIYKKARALRVHGSVQKYHYDYIGYNSRLDTLQAAILKVKLSHIVGAIEARNKHCSQYCELLKGINEIKLPVIKNTAKSVCYAFCIQAEKRDELNSYLQSKNIGTSVYYPLPLHLQNCFKYLGYKKGDFPAAERLSTKALALPMFPELTEDEINFVCECIKEFYRR